MACARLVGVAALCAAALLGGYTVGLRQFQHAASPLSTFEGKAESTPASPDSKAGGGCDHLRSRCCSYVIYGIRPGRGWGSTPSSSKAWYMAHKCDDRVGGTRMSFCPYSCHGGSGRLNSSSLPPPPPHMRRTHLGSLRSAGGTSFALRMKDSRPLKAHHTGSGAGPASPPPPPEPAPFALYTGVEYYRFGYYFDRPIEAYGSCNMSFGREHKRLCVQANARTPMEYYAKTWPSSLQFKHLNATNKSHDFEVRPSPTGRASRISRQEPAPFST